VTTLVRLRLPIVALDLPARSRPEMIFLVYDLVSWLSRRLGWSAGPKKAQLMV